MNVSLFLEATPPVQLQVGQILLLTEETAWTLSSSPMHAEFIIHIMSSPCWDVTFINEYLYHGNYACRTQFMITTIIRCNHSMCDSVTAIHNKRQIVGETEHAFLVVIYTACKSLAKWWWLFLGTSHFDLEGWQKYPPAGFCGGRIPPWIYEYL